MPKTFLRWVLVGSVGLASPLNTAERAHERVPDVESVMQKWTVVPETVFPLEVKVTRETDVQHYGKRVPIKSGTKLKVSALLDSQLEAVTADGSYQAFWVAVDDTDFKARVTVLYQSWAERLHAVAVYDGSKHDSGVNGASAPMDARAAFDAMRLHYDGGRQTRFFDPSGRPKRSADGSYPLLLESMDSGQVTEITRSNLEAWGVPEQRTLHGKSYWVVKVKYRNLTTFGSLYSEAAAWIRGTRVERWLYEGSGEAVP